MPETLQEQTKNSPSVLWDASPENFKNNFLAFFTGCFLIAVNRVDGEVLETPHLDEFCYRLQKYNRTSTQAPRFHLKSTITEAFIMWKLLRCEHSYNEWMYMSFTESLGAYHTKRIKRYIAPLHEKQYFGGIEPLSDSESLIYFKNPQGRVFYCEPAGIMTLQRGKHPHGMILDDILKDPQVKLDLTQIEKITTIFFEEVEQMPKEDLHIVGTPQDATDLFSQLENKKGYHSRKYDAFADEKNRVSLWPEKYSFDWLEERRRLIGDKAFLKEFRCQPVRGSEGFISLKDYSNISCKRLKNYDISKSVRLKDRNVVAGFDIGKKTHPSHLSVFAERKGRLIQIHQKFMDGWNYNDQIDYCGKAIKFFGIDVLDYDNTRAEFDVSLESGKLPKQMKGVVFTSKSKFTMSTEVDKLVTSKKILLIDEPRQKRQILSVDCDLNAPETSEGHGDAFFSLCLAVKAWADLGSKGGFEVPTWDVIGRNSRY